MIIDRVPFKKKIQKKRVCQTGCKNCSTALQWNARWKVLVSPHTARQVAKGENFVRNRHSEPLGQESAVSYK